MLSFPKFLRQSYKQFWLPAPSVRQSSWLRPPKFCWWAGSAPLHPVLHWLHDLLYKNECQNWRNKINKAKKTSGFPADRLEEMLAAFESFKKEALQRKQAVKKKTASPKEFSGWLLRQSNIIVELAETENWHFSSKSFQTEWFLLPGYGCCLLPWPMPSDPEISVLR